MGTLGRLLKWAGKNVIKTTVLIGILVTIGFEVHGLVSHKNAIRDAIKVTASVPPVGNQGGTYAYRVKLGPGATSRGAEIVWIEVDNRAYVTLSDGHTTVESWSTFVTDLKTVTASGPGATDAGLSFDVGADDTSYTLGELTTDIRYNYTILWTEFNLKTIFEATVPVAFQNITTEAQQMDDEAWTAEERADMAEQWFDSVPDGEEEEQ